LSFLWIGISSYVLLLCWGGGRWWTCSNWWICMFIWIVINREYRADQNCDSDNDNFPQSHDIVLIYLISYQDN
jgi:hypothetical protein